MKKVIFLIYLFIGFISINAQTVDGIPLKDFDVEYMQIIERKQPTLSDQIIVLLDFGQEIGTYYNSKKNTQVKDENGNPIYFNSIIPALNFMIKHGYDYVDSHTATWPTPMGGGMFTSYILRKKR